MASVEYTVQPTQKIGGSLIIQEITQALDQLPDDFDLQRAPPDMSKKELFMELAPLIDTLKNMKLRLHELRGSL